MCRVCVLYLPRILHQSCTLNSAPFFMENVDYQSFISKEPAWMTKTTIETKSTENPPERVGEPWPKLLSKKFLAIQFQCWSNNRINTQRFRRLVLTPEVLQAAGIPPEIAYSQTVKTFNAVQSMNLLKVLNPIIALLLLAVSTTSAQTPAPAPTSEPIHQFKTDTVKNGNDYVLRDTIPGLAVVTDSMVRMVYTGQSGLYKYQSVMSTIVVDALMVQEYRILVSGPTGVGDPREVSRRFFFLTGGTIDPKRIVLFKQGVR